MSHSERAHLYNKHVDIKRFFGFCVCCVILRNVNDFVLSFLFIVFWCCRAFGGCLGAYGPKKDVVACDMPRGIG